MKKLVSLAGIAIVLTGIFGCEKLMMHPNPSQDNLAIFDEYTTLVKEKYAMLDFKGVDIDHVSDSLRATLTNDMPEDSLMVKIAQLCKLLRDGHSSIIRTAVDGSLTGYAFDPSAGYPIAINDTLLQDYYTGANVAPNIQRFEKEDGDVLYGYLPQSSTVAYIQIPSFLIDMTDEELETMFQSISSSVGLILDVRGNGGGDPALATKIASYFMSSQTYTGFERFKIGPGANDFSDSPSYVTPSNSAHKYLKPVVVLTDRGVYSATTTLCYNLNPLPQVTFLGQRTGGGSGSVADGYLANGWHWSLSTSEFIDHLGNHLDDGIDPDISVAFINNNGVDELIEAAIQLLE
jgi:hypothetical protein